MNSTNTYPLSKEEKAAIDKALEVSEKGNYYSREEVMKEAREKYPKLKFK